MRRAVHSRWKLIDLDGAVPIGEPRSAVHCRGSSAFQAPEVFQALQQDVPIIGAPAHDIWAFGTVLYKAVTGVDLFLTDVYVGDD